MATLAIFGAIAQAHAGHEQARIIREQGRVEKQLGFLEAVKGEANANEVRRTLIADLAATTADAAARGVDIGSGSAVVIEQDIERQGQLAISRELTTGRVKAEVRRQNARFLRKGAFAKDLSTFGQGLSGIVGGAAAAN